MIWSWTMCYWTMKATSSWQITACVKKISATAKPLPPSAVRYSDSDFTVHLTGFSSWFRNPELHCTRDTSGRGLLFLRGLVGFGSSPLWNVGRPKSIWCGWGHWKSRPKYRGLFVPRYFFFSRRICLSFKAVEQGWGEPCSFVWSFLSIYPILKIVIFKGQ